MSLQEKLIEAVTEAESASNSDLLIILGVRPLGVEVIGYVNKKKARHLTSWEEIERSNINPLLSAIKRVQADLL